MLELSALEGLLGDPADPSALLNRGDILAWDAAAEFPESAIEVLNHSGLAAAYVPAEFGGELTSLSAPMSVFREIARRDMTVAVAHGKTFLGAICAWILGGDAAREMSGVVLAGDAVAWGLTERGRGSDLIRSATRLTRDVGGDRLTGAKWPINNATRGRAMTVLARTSDTPGAAGLSLVFVDKRRLDGRGASPLPKVRTHGIRGADISGQQWEDVRLPPGSLMGEPGRGIDTVLKGLQLTRIACTALSLGGIDRAVEEVLLFGSTRHVAGRALLGYPLARADLGAMIADSLIAEAVVAVGADQVQDRPHELALVSALVKFVVPDLGDRVFRDATRFLGARAVLSDFRDAGLFAKAARDSRVVGIFDGSSIVTLNAIVMEFPSIDRGLMAKEVATPRRTTEIDFGALRLGTRRGSSVLTAIAESVAVVAQLWGAHTPAIVENFAGIADGVLREVQRAPRAPTPSAAQFDLARRVAEVFAGACVLLTAGRASTAEMTELANEPVWVEAALNRIVARLRRPVAAPHDAYLGLADVVLESGKKRLVEAVKPHAVR